MFETVVNFVKASRPLQFAVVFLAGGTIAAIFYPTKQIKETLTKTFQSQISTLNQQHSQEMSDTKTKYDAQIQTLTTSSAQMSDKISSLTTQISTLKSHQKKTYYKIVHPDGTIEVRASSEKDTDEEDKIATQIQQEYDQQLKTEVAQLEQQHAETDAALQKQWDSKEQSYQSQISTLTQTKTVTVNPKNFAIDAGVLSNLSYYGHATYNIWGPLLIGIHGELGTSNALGGGIGLRF